MIIPHWCETSQACHRAAVIHTSQTHHKGVRHTGRQAYPGWLRVLVLHVTSCSHLFWLLNVQLRLATYLTCLLKPEPKMSDRL